LSVRVIAALTVLGDKNHKLASLPLVLNNTNWSEQAS